MRPIIAGAWRDDATGPMQVISGPVGKERVHYEAPAAPRLPEEIERFLKDEGGGRSTSYSVALD